MTDVKDPGKNSANMLRSFDATESLDSPQATFSDIDLTLMRLSSGVLALRSPVGPCALALLMSILLGGVRAADLEVEVRGVKPQGGDIIAGLFDNGRDFALDLEVRAMISSGGEISAGIFSQEEYLPCPPTQGIRASPTASTIVLRFTGLNPGEYAVALFQDRNGNGRLDVTLGRIAVEPWGMSNNPKPEKRGPTWDDAKFALPEGGTKIIIDLHL